MRRSRADRASAGGSYPVRAPRTAPAGDFRIAGGVVVVGELLTLPERAGGADPDQAILDFDPAVRRAGMIDEPREVSADAGVDHPAAVQREAPDAALREVLLLTLEALLVRDLLARVVGDARVLGNGLGRVHAPARNPGLAALNHRGIKIHD